MALKFLTPQLEQSMEVVRPGKNPGRFVEGTGPLQSPPQILDAMNTVSQELIAARTANTPVPRMDGIGSQRMQDLIAPPDDILTPPGVAAPSEIQNAVGGVNKVMQALQTPGVRSMLAQLGMAIGGDSSGGRIAAVADVLAQGQIHKNLMAGETNTGLGANSIAAASPQTRAAAQQALNERRQLDLHEREVGVAEQRAETDASLAGAQEEGIRAEIALNDKEFRALMDNRAFERILASAEIGLKAKGLSLEEQKLQFLEPIYKTEAALNRARATTESAQQALLKAQEQNIGNEVKTQQLAQVTGFVNAINTDLGLLDEQQATLSARIDMIARELSNPESKMNAVDRDAQEKLLAALRQRQITLENQAAEVLGQRDLIYSKALESAMNILNNGNAPTP